MKYVLGFAFGEVTTPYAHVALIEKIKPEWQKGLLNGIGGKIESAEEPADAMSREFFEETGVSIPAGEWDLFGTLSGPGYSIHLFRTFTNEVYECLTQEEEKVRVKPVYEFLHFEKVIPNLHWLIPMALDKQVYFGEIKYKS